MDSLAALYIAQGQFALAAAALAGYACNGLTPVILNCAKRHTAE